LRTKYATTDVHHWGRNGWNYKDQISFLKAEGIKYKPDLLLVSWYMNDVFGGDVDSLSKLMPSHPIGLFQPNILSSVYSSKGLSEYMDSLRMMKKFLEANNIKVTFCIISNAPSLYRDYTEQGKAAILQAGFPVCDLDSIVSNQLPNSLHRNFLFFAAPNDFHSGPLLNQLYANAALHWLTERGLLKNLPANRRGVLTRKHDPWRAR
jgi:hypothetical protein